MTSNFEIGLRMIGRRWIAAALVLAGQLAAMSAASSRVIAQSPYATQLISENAAFGTNALYNDPNAVLGEPTRIAVNGDPEAGASPYHVKITEAVYNREFQTNNKVVTTLSHKSDGAGGYLYGSITVKFDHPVVDDPANPYGIDLNVFGNSFYQGFGVTDDTTDMRSHILNGYMLEEPVVISVSPDNTNWYTYSTGPFGDTAFPTQGYEWSGEQHDAPGSSNGWTTIPTDFTKPVNPKLNTLLGVPGQQIAAANAMATYVGAGGGAGIDLAPSGFAAIHYVRVEATSQFRDGEIDAFADVRPMHVGDSLAVTLADITSATSLFFQDPADESRTAVRATFASLSGYGKLATANVTDAAALGALPNETLLASYQLDVLPLFGISPVSFEADFQLSPGNEPIADGDNLHLWKWSGAAWMPVAFDFDSATGRLTLDNWNNPSATLAITQPAVSPATGDFNDDGHIDAADYIAWRKGAVGPIAESDYTAWRKNFGSLVGSNGGAINATAAPEPMAALLIAFAVACIAFFPPRNLSSHEKHKKAQKVVRVDIIG
jgi:hypothetical protein